MILELVYPLAYYLGGFHWSVFCLHRLQLHLGFWFLFTEPERVLEGIREALAERLRQNQRQKNAADGECCVEKIWDPRICEPSL